MEFKCLPQQVLDSFTESELAISLKCFWPKTIQNQLVTLTTWMDVQTNSLQAQTMELSDFGTLMIIQSKPDV